MDTVVVMLLPLRQGTAALSAHASVDDVASSFKDVPLTEKAGIGGGCGVCVVGGGGGVGGGGSLGSEPVAEGGHVGAAAGCPLQDKRVQRLLYRLCFGGVHVAALVQGTESAGAAACRLQELLEPLRAASASSASASAAAADVCSSVAAHAWPQGLSLAQALQALADSRSTKATTAAAATATGGGAAADPADGPSTAALGGGMNTSGLTKHRNVVVVTWDGGMAEEVVAAGCDAVVVGVGRGSVQPAPLTAPPQAPRTGSLHAINSPDELLPLLISLRAKSSNMRVRVLGYAMKWSRELDFLKRRAFPLCPVPVPGRTAAALAFLPLDLAAVAAQQQQQHLYQQEHRQQLAADLPPGLLTAVLHKASDEIAGYSVVRRSTQVEGDDEEQSTATVAPRTVAAAAAATAAAGVVGDVEGLGVQVELSQRFHSLVRQCAQTATPPIRLMDPLDGVLLLTDRLATLRLLQRVLPHMQQQHPQWQSSWQTCLHEQQGSSSSSSSSSSSISMLTPAVVVRTPRFVAVSSIDDVRAVITDRTTTNSSGPCSSSPVGTLSASHVLSSSASASSAAPGGPATGTPDATPSLPMPTPVSTAVPSTYPLALACPVIVKPLVACGVDTSHSMAVVLSRAGLHALSVPMPAVVQEYVDHGAVIHKCYMIGDAFFVAQRRSTPDAASLSLHPPPPTSRAAAAAASPAEAQPTDTVAVVQFHSLRSLPTSFGPPTSQATAAAAVAAAVAPSPPSGPDSGAMVGGRDDAGTKKAGAVAAGFDKAAAEAAARLLQKHLNLRLFGFDVVVQQGTGDHVIVDVNYFPSFKEVPDEHAIPALWAACFDSASA